MTTMPSCPAGRRGGVSAEVYCEEDAACYVKKVTFFVWNTFGISFSFEFI